MGTKKKSRCFSGTLLTMVLTALLLFAGREAISTHAAESQMEFQPVESENFTVPKDRMLPDNDELFAGYVMQSFYGGETVALSDYGEIAGVLNPLEKTIYGELKTAVGKIAKGETASTKIIVGRNPGITWTTDKTGEELEYEIEEKVREKVNIEKIVDCLLADCPYEMYWFDKTKGYACPYRYMRSAQTISIVDFPFEFVVAQDYAGAADDNGKCYTVDSRKIGAVSEAVTNARNIMIDNASKSDYKKLTAYKEAICELTDYNHDAADSNYTGGYGDPWQMIYVFDGDPATKVVCEGYSKAFQYLCDISEFDEEVTCYTVTGYMGGGTGAGGHMWNIVTLNEKNYLVDVTNSDDNSIGQGGELFLAGTTGTVEQGYKFQIGEEKISYTYKNPAKPETPGDAVELYGKEILTLAECSYEKFLKPVFTKQPENQTVTYGEMAKALQVSVQQNGNLQYQYQWYLNGYPIENANNSRYQPPQEIPGLDAGIYRYKCIVSCEGKTTASEEAVLTVEPILLSPVVTKVDHTDKVYDGTYAVLDEQGIEITVKGSIYAADDISPFYTIRYNSSNVKEANKIIIEFTLEGEDAGNYRVETLEIPGSILPKELTAEISVYDKEYDGTTNARIARAKLKGIYSYGGIVIDDVTLNLGKAAFTSQKVGNNIPVRFEGFTLSGADASNYTLKLPKDVTASITEAKKPAKAPKKAALTSVKVVSGKKLNIRWKKISGASGYEVQCCLKKNFKSGVKKGLAKNGNKTSLVIKKLKKGKVYYVRIRAYKTVKVNGKPQKLYGAWSKVKKSKKIK